MRKITSKNYIKNVILIIFLNFFIPSLKVYTQELNKAFELFKKEEYLGAAIIFENNLKNSINNYGEYDTIIVTQNLSWIALSYFMAKEYNKSEAYFLKCNKIYEFNKDTLNINYILNIRSLSNLYIETAKYEKAILLLTRAQQLYEELYGYCHVQNINANNAIAYIYSERKNYPKAEHYYLIAKDIYETCKISKNDKYVELLYYFGQMYKEVGDFSKARNFYCLATETIKKNGGENSDKDAMLLNNLSIIYLKLGMRDSAEYLLLKSNELSKRIHGEESIEYASSLINIGLFYSDLAEYERALNYCNKSKTIYEDLYGKSNLDYISSLTSIASIYNAKGEFKRAEKIYLESLELINDINGERTFTYANILNNLGLLTQYAGQFTRSKEYFLEALDVVVKEYGDISYYSYLTLNNLASLYSAINDYNNAELCFNSQLEIHKQLFDDNELKYAVLLNDIGVFYLDQGIYERAEKLFKESQVILLNNTDKNHPKNATLLNNLGLLYSNTSRAKLAEESFLQSIEISKSIFGFNDKSLLIPLGNIAILYSRTGKDSLAEIINLFRLEIAERTFGSNSIERINPLNSLGVSCERNKKFDEAEKYYNEALKIVKDYYSPEHPIYSTIYSNLALLYQKKGEYNKAERYLIDVIKNTLNDVNKHLLFLSENEMSQYLLKLQFNFEILYSLCLKNNNSQSLGVAYDCAMQTKQLLLNTSFAMRNAILSSGDMNLINKFNDWLLIQNQILVLNSNHKNNSDSVVKSLEKQVVSIEKELKRLSSEFYNTSVNSKLNWQDIKLTLKPNEAAIEFIRFKYYDTKWSDSIYYCALLIKPNYDFPILIKLCEEKGLAELLSNARYGSSFNQASLLYGHKRSAKLVSADDNSNYSDSLYILVWEPIDSFLKDVKVVYYSPVGLLCNISFSALANSDSTLLLDKYDLNYLSSTRNIINPVNLDFNSTKTNAIIYGGLKYDIDENEMAYLSSQNKSYHANHLSNNRNLSISDSTRNISWNYLEGTLTEAENINEIIANNEVPTILYTGANGNEESFKTNTGINSPKIIHIATHGFYWPKIDTNDIDNNYGLLGADNFIKKIDNPLTRSGIILSGANTAWKGGLLPTGVEDGILTAYEVSLLNLFNTSLVVLSACETGLGEIKENEGILGMQRAFKMSGVEYLILSLWQVSDKETAEFMTQFYRNLFELKEIIQAFNKTQKEMRQKYDPYYWAAFVLVN